MAIVNSENYHRCRKRYKVKSIKFICSLKYTEGTCSLVTLMT